MGILVNGRFLSRRITGVERYATELLNHLGSRVKIIGADRPRQGVWGHLWEQIFLPQKISANDILWSPANTGPLSVPNQVLTLQDLNPLEHPNWYSPAYSYWYRFFLPLLINVVSRIVVSSNYTERKLIKRFSLSPQKVVTIPAGVDLEKFRRSDPSDIRNRYGLPEHYLLFVGSLQPGKNLTVLLQAWSLLTGMHPKFGLVVAGVGAKVFRQVQYSGKMDNVHFIGYIPDPDLPALYSGASAFIFPSLEEGFGLPLLEAMACGTPVLASTAGAIPEVVSDCALLFDPANVTELAARIDSFLRDRPLQQSLRVKGLERSQQFSWRISAEQLWKVLQT